MVWLVVLGALGIPVGFLLLGRISFCTAGTSAAQPLSIIIPARNEERNLPHLLASLQPHRAGTEVLVVDDDSADNTAAVARNLEATVLPARPLEPGWTGKTWACSQGAQAARHDLLLFLDADTWFAPAGLERLLACAPSDVPAAISVLPYHVMRRPYEQLSLFFNLLMATGAGGFGLIGSPRLFGQCLLIPRALYNQAGGHAVVRRHILENFALSSHIQTAGAPCVCYCGRGVLNVRMFPDGLRQLGEGWIKAFADGAAASHPAVLLLSIFWLTSLCSTFLMLLLSAPAQAPIFIVIYLLSALQLWWFSSRIGTYSVLACLLYPLPLFFYFALFGQSLFHRLFKRRVSWRGRQI